jgi:hypothetical protein
VKVWFVVGSSIAHRFIEPVIAALVADGHDVHVSIERGGSHVYPTVPAVPVTPLAVPSAAPTLGDRRLRGAAVVRAFASYVALRTCFGTLMRERWLAYFPPGLNRLVRFIDGVSLSRLLDNRATRLLAMRWARAISAPRTLVHQLQALNPDVVVTTPMIYPGTRELDVIPEARRRAIPTVGFVLSWDNLTSKATFHYKPDALLVWNEAQRREAVEWHGFAPDEVEALGAPVFDYLFDSHDRATRPEVLSALGVEDNDYVLYAVSSRLALGSGREADVVKRLGEALRAEAGTPRLLLVRPHPGNPIPSSAPLGPNVVVAPTPSFPNTPNARRELLALLAHADAIVGLNTSIFVEAAVLGTPVVAMSLAGDVAAERGPSSLPHFSHLVAAGFVHCVTSPAEAAVALADVRARGDDRQDAAAAFVREFVRPCGIDRPAATLVAERIVSVG